MSCTALAAAAVVSTVDTVVRPVAASVESLEAAKLRRSASRGAAVLAAAQGPYASSVDFVAAAWDRSRGWALRTGDNTIAAPVHTARSVSTR